MSEGKGEEHQQELGFLGEGVELPFTYYLFGPNIHKCNTKKLFEKWGTFFYNVL